jgi:hypothetical protein
MVGVCVCVGPNGGRSKVSIFRVHQKRPHDNHPACPTHNTANTAAHTAPCHGLHRCSSPHTCAMVAAALRRFTAEEASLALCSSAASCLASGEAPVLISVSRLMRSWLSWPIFNSCTAVWL